jgi:hypothetical protein
MDNNEVMEQTAYDEIDTDIMRFERELAERLIQIVVDLTDRVKVLERVVAHQEAVLDQFGLAEVHP